MTTVSVVIPAYNAERYIGDALAFIREQTFRGVEVLVVDDGSTDNTLREVERLADSIEMRVIRQENAGPAAARDAGIRMERGLHCAFLDADDVMLPERLHAQVRLLESEPDLGFVHSDLMTFDDRGIVHRTRRAFSEPCGGWSIDQLLLDNFITTSTVLAPREKLLEAGLYDEDRRVSEDFALSLRMASCWEVGFIDRPLVQYRRRPGSLSDDKLATGRSAIEVIETFWREPPQYRESHPTVYRRSLARHLATAGSAALERGESAAALGYLVRSLAYTPWEPRSWRWLAKTTVQPFLRRKARPGSGHGGGVA